jgi:hypothetical protein
MYFQDLSSNVLKASKVLKISMGKPKKQFCIRLVIAYHGGQKNRNGKTIEVFFYHVFH